MDNLTRAAAAAQRMYDRLDHSDVGRRYDDVLRERDRMEWRVRDRFEEVWEDVEERHHASARQPHERDSTRNGGRSLTYSREQQRRSSQQQWSRPPDDWQSHFQAENVAPRHDYQTREVRPADRRHPNLPADYLQSVPGPVPRNEPTSHHSQIPAYDQTHAQRVSLPPGYDTALAESHRTIEAFLNDEYDPPPAYSSRQDQPHRKDRRNKDIRAKDHEKALSWLAGRTTLGGNRRS